MTRNTFGLRNIRGSGILEGNYLCDGGAERLILEWKVQRDRWIDEQLDPAFENLLRNAGSSTFTYQKVTNIKEHEELLLQTSLAPFESDGPDDTAEWNLFDSFLKPRDGRENLNDRHNISTMLRRWKHGVVCMSPSL